MTHAEHMEVPVKTGYYIKVDPLFWTGGFRRGETVLTAKASRAVRFSARQVVEDVLEDVQRRNPGAILVTHFASEQELL